MLTTRRATPPQPCRALLLVFALCVLPTAGVFGNVGLTPMHMDVVAPPGGGGVSVELTVVNTSNQPRTVRFTVEDFTIDGHGGLLFRHELQAPSPSLDILEGHAGSPYVTLEEGEVDLAPLEERVVTCMVSLPQNALGQYYAMVRADAGVVTPQVGGASAHNLRVSLQVGAFLFITAGWPSQDASGDGDVRPPRRATPATYDLKVADLHVEFPAPGDERQTLRVVAEVANRSTVHFIGDVTAVILNTKDRRILERVRFSQGARLVLPNSRRVYVGEVRSRLDAGVYRIRFSVDGATRRLRVSATTNVELTEPAAGLGAGGGPMRVISVTPPDHVTLGATAGMTEQRIRVYNNTDDALRVETLMTAQGDASPRLRVTPKRLNIPRVASAPFACRRARGLGTTLLPSSWRSSRSPVAGLPSPIPRRAG